MHAAEMAIKLARAICHQPQRKAAKIKLALSCALSSRHARKAEQRNELGCCVTANPLVRVTLDAFIGLKRFEASPSRLKGLLVGER